MSRKKAKGFGAGASADARANQKVQLTELAARRAVVTGARVASADDLQNLTPGHSPTAIAEARLASAIADQARRDSEQPTPQTVTQPQTPAPDVSASQSHAAPAPQNHAPQPAAPAAVEPVNANGKLVMDEEHIDAMVRIKAHQAQQAAQVELDRQRLEFEAKTKLAFEEAEKANEAVKVAEARAAAAEANTAKLSSVYESMALGHNFSPSAVGSRGPVVHSDSATGTTWQADGLARDFKDLFEKAGRSSVSDRMSGRMFTQVDTSEVSAFVKEVDRGTLKHGIERDMVSHGFLTGGARRHDITAPVDVPHYYREFLATEMRRSHNPTRVFHQFVKNYSRPDAMPGGSIRVARIQRIAPPISADAWKLTYQGVTSTNRQPIESSSVLIPIEMWGMGGGDAATDAIALSEFVLAANLNELITNTYDALGRNYRDWEDTLIRTVLFSSTRKLYSNNGTVVDLPGSVTTGGTFTYEFLVNLHARMSEEEVPPFTPDGKFGLWLAPKQLAQLKLDIQDKRAPRDEMDIKRLSEMLMPAVNTGEDLVDGYAGSYGGFHIFSSNAIGRADSADAGDIAVQTETTGAGAKLTRSGLAFGGDVLARVNVAPFEIIEDDWHRYNSERSFVWRECSGIAGLDIDGNRTPVSQIEGTTDRSSEQVRVFRVHTTDAAVA